MKGGCKGKPAGVRPTAGAFPQGTPFKGTGKGFAGAAAAQASFPARPGSNSEVGRLLATVGLSNFEQGVKRLGVESAADLKYVTPQDLEAMHMTVIQRRKFEELAGTGGGGGRALGGGGGRDRSRSRGRRDAAGAKGQGKNGKDSWKTQAEAKPAPWGQARPGMPKPVAVPKPATSMGKGAPWQSGAQGSKPWSPGGAMAKPGGPPTATPLRVHGGPKAPGGPPPGGAAPKNDDVVKEAERRLRENGARKFYWEEVAKLKRDYKLSERVELALKLLEPAKLNSLLRDSGDLTRMLQHSPDKDKLIRTLVARQDPVVNQLVSQLEAKETAGKGKGAPAAAGAGAAGAAAKGKGKGGKGW